MFFFFNLHSGVFMWNTRMGVLGFGCLREHCRLSGLLCCVARVFGAVIVGLVLLCWRSIFLECFWMTKKLSTGVGDTNKLHVFLLV